METNPDLTIEESKYVRMPVKFLWGLLGLWAVMVWSYSNVMVQIADNRKTTDTIAQTVKEDHQALMGMHDAMVQLNDFAEESKRMYNRYFRDYTDPDRSAK